jgi:N-acylglucosamine-6-phosphate 2-epimerase
MGPLGQLRGGLVVSCQPVDGGPMDRPDIVAAMARAAVLGGAVGLRIEGLDNLRAARAVCDLPIIGILKRDLADSDVRITPLLGDVAGLAGLGADIVAYDATQRSRPVATRDIVAAIRGAGCIAMADCSSASDGARALRDGAQVLGTTLSGYVDDLATLDAPPDLGLVRGFASLGRFVIAEGRYNTPALAAQAMRAGADCVTVGSAITRLEHVTGWFAAAVGGHGDI